ncbi:hypothetical protein A3F66_01950 [candidate division TM6 bacterium RIFCSPHIGHO2_12_FULL_32_22]|nr:MAG: hypothetical protein A3F66_01950 [candidate division TM6 bacterium RIFCSPHIGHO2_12_FULL_32_22]
MIKRQLKPSLLLAAKEYPIVALLGPRQSGKTTLAINTFPNYKYVSLEDPDTREYVTKDPRDFLETNKNEEGIIIDEAQYVPSLFSYIQTMSDKQKKRGYFILTGSQNFLLSEAITQSLAGRVSILTLLPLSISELKENDILPSRAEEIMFQGMYPSIYSDEILPKPRAAQWYYNYIRSYIEKDVRQIKNVTNLSDFRKFMQLCAARTGQLLNLTPISIECGISVNTAKSWLSLLESSYIIYLLQPYSKGFTKRVIKTPKLFFYDTGIVASLLKLDTLDKIIYETTIKGNMFESLMISEIIKSSYNHDKAPNTYFWRDKTGHEIDCIIDEGTSLLPIEIKFGKTIRDEFFSQLNYWNQLTGSNPKDGYLVYGGSEHQKRSVGNVISWKDVDKIVFGYK